MKISHLCSQNALQKCHLFCSMPILRNNEMRQWMLEQLRLSRLSNANYRVLWEVFAGMIEEFPALHRKIPLQVLCK